MLKRLLTGWESLKRWVSSVLRTSEETSFIEGTKMHIYLLQEENKKRINEIKELEKYLDMLHSHFGGLENLVKKLQLSIVEESIFSNKLSASHQNLVEKLKGI